MTARRAMLRTAVLVALTTLFAAGTGASAAVADATDISVQIPDAHAVDGEVGNAQLRWALNAESGSGAYFGGCNFLSAGVAGDTGSPRVWTAADGFHRARDGAVRIEAPDGRGGMRTPDFASRCLDAAGQPVTASSTASTTGNQVVMDGGSGTIGAAGTELRWTGSFTVAFYGGLTYWSATDPVLRLDAGGNGSLVATLSGYGSSMDDLSKWVRLEGRSVTLAEFRGASVSQRGFQATPAYLGVQVPDAGQAPRTAENGSYWGSFPADFISFQKLTGQTGYWLTTGGARDQAKVASAVTVNADAAAPAFAPPAAAAASGGDPRNEVVFRPRAGAPATAPVVASGNPVASQAATAFSRDSAFTLVPERIAESAPLAAGTFALCALVSILSVLSLTGRLRMPWSPAARR